MDSRLWDSVFPALARRHTAIRFDARGLGRSSLPAELYWDVADLLAALDHFGIERAALVGLSLGGETSLDFALAGRWGDRFRSRRSAARGWERPSGAALPGQRLV
ncbi:alpha/beta fold hydrolase [Saccharopolyspora elongata]|uniref:Alpha/beta fold hydrolase n=2 Tax=Saccharopolyspora elongata TaxID=2530387 RepID=A0A4R4YY98_9PSEU|nr:alpha/beta fold hydrolase [Saccharopolyspora elongata]